MKKYAIDFSHSTIGFSVRHMMISRIHGTFESYSGEIVTSISNKCRMQTFLSRLQWLVSPPRIMIVMSTLCLLTF